MKQTKFPTGWNARRIRRVLEHYEERTDVEAVHEDESALRFKDHTVMAVPTELVPAIRELIATHDREHAKRRKAPRKS
jgi:hypothetical protein